MMRWNPLNVSVETLIAASPLLGHELEDRQSIRSGQDERLVNRFAFASSVPLRSESQRNLFCVAPLDLLASESGGAKRFHLLELNGTGVGGLTNLTDQTLCSILESLADTSATFDRPGGLVLLAISGKESTTNPRLNRLMHEKLLFAEAIRQGLSRSFGRSDVTNVDYLKKRRDEIGPQRPAVVMGYMKDFLNSLELENDGTLRLHGRPVMGAVNDRFCRNLLQRFGPGVDLNRFKILNRCFAAGSDKGVAYSLMNEFIAGHPNPIFPASIPHAHAHDRAELIQTVLAWLKRDRKFVIKPHGAGLGHGIEFFLDASESAESVIKRIDQSLAQTEEYYGIPGGALPYTVCEYVDACRVQSPEHPLQGHKYELRVVVYRMGDRLQAFPSIAKVARERDDQNGSCRRALINNITASGDTDKVNGADYMMPLCNEQSFTRLGLSMDEMQSLCSLCTGYVRHVLDRVEDDPAFFGLPRENAMVERQFEAIAA